jgi:hypothetical protein
LKKLSEGAFCYAFHDNYLSKLVFPSELNDNLTISGFGNSVFRWTNVNDVYSYIQDPKPISSILIMPLIIYIYQKVLWIIIKTLLGGIIGLINM